MITGKKESLQIISDELHRSIARKRGQAGCVKDDIMTESRMFAVLCDTPDIEPRVCAVRLEKKYGYDIDGDEIIRMFRRRRMANPHERKALFEWADKLSELFAEAAGGDEKAFSEFEKLRKENALNPGRRNDSQDRICAIMIYRKYPEIVTNGDEDILYSFGNTLGKYFFYDISDAVCKAYGFPGYRDSKSDTGKNGRKRMTLEQAMKRIDSLETELERTGSMLAELQNEFDEQLAESKVKELTDFFAKLNSEKYGCILDQLLELGRGVDKLKRNGTDVPIEINGLLIVIKKMIRFVRDSHIDPILKPDSTMIVKAADIEFYDYIGSPFLSGLEEKCVRTLSPGWIFRDKEIQISRPRVKEEEI